MAGAQVAFGERGLGHGVVRGEGDGGLCQGTRPSQQLGGEHHRRDVGDADRAEVEAHRLVLPAHERGVPNVQEEEELRRQPQRLGVAVPGAGEHGGAGGEGLEVAILVGEQQGERPVRAKVLGGDRDRIAERRFGLGYATGEAQRLGVGHERIGRGDRGAGRCGEARSGGHAERAAERVVRGPRADTRVARGGTMRRTVSMACQAATAPAPSAPSA